jgi:hypothetical protein
LKINRRVVLGGGNRMKMHRHFGFQLEMSIEKSGKNFPPNLTINKNLESSKLTIVTP